MKEKMTVRQRRLNHEKRHPNSNNSKKEKFVIWSKPNKKLEKFYEEHIYTFIDENDPSKKKWIRIAGFNKGDEEWKQ